MYAYSLLVHSPGSSTPGEWEPVRSGPDMLIATTEQLCNQVREDLGFVPDWMLDLQPEEYVGVESEHEIRGTWFCLEIEGSQDHVMPPLAERIAWERAARNRTLERHFPPEIAKTD